MTIYRVELDAPRGAEYADCFFDIFAKDIRDAWKRAIETEPDYRILRIWAVRAL